MEELVIPGWAIVLLSSVGSLILGWLIYLTIRTFENREAIAVNTAHDAQVSKELQQIHTAIDNVRTSFTSDLKDLNQKLDMFLAQELQYLKRVNEK